MFWTDGVVLSVCVTRLLVFLHWLRVTLSFSQSLPCSSLFNYVLLSGLSSVGYVVYCFTCLYLWVSSCLSLSSEYLVYTGVYICSGVP